MELKKIRLAGFKSFVDPITVPVPGHLVAIVGPNGCGKSNIIDAVCWVMGESSAKHLRGESLTDVIFNGSSARKPVGQASVELIFDNQDGSIGGEFAQYAEVSIRRVINRDSESSWYLNGTRCRRRDIVDIFLGTGLGPRSYSIIGQNMISRIIEAKPEEMRSYLEEAAGISRYRERRRETENRIKHTRENMDRLNDIRTELQHQLETLKRQADAASKYKLLKQEERILKASGLALQWRALDGRRVQLALQIQQQETGLEAKHADMLEIAFGMDQRREEHRLAGEAFQEIQHRFYTAGNEITRIEQDIHHTRERERQWRMDHEQAENEHKQAEKNLSEVSVGLEKLNEELSALRPAFEAARAAATDGEKTHRSALDALGTWQTRWDEFNEAFSSAGETARVEQTRITQLDQRLTQLTARLTQLTNEQNEGNHSRLDQETARLQQVTEEAEQRVKQAAARLEDLRTRLKEGHEQQRQMGVTLDHIRRQQQTLHGQKASLEALQQTALGQRDQAITQWLKTHGLDAKPRLAEGLKVESGWESAVEKVLGISLQSVCVDSLQHFMAPLAELPQGNFCGFSASASNLQTEALSGRKLLIDCIQSKWPLSDLLAGIYIADSLSDAETLCRTLKSHESVVTREGVWLGPSWIRVLREDNPAAGVFQRGQELQHLSQQLENLAAQQGSVESDIATQSSRLTELEKQRDAAQTQLNECNAEVARAGMEKKVHAERLRELQVRDQNLTKEREQIIRQTEQLQGELKAAKIELEQAQAYQQEHAGTREILLHERDALRETERERHTHTEQLRAEAHQAELRLQTAVSRQETLTRMLAQSRQQLEACADRRIHLQHEAAQIAPLDSLEAELTAFLNQRMQIETELNAARATTESLAIELGDAEAKRQHMEVEAGRIRDLLESLRVESEGLAIRTETLQAQIIETGVDLGELLTSLPENADPPEEYQTRLQKVQQRIQRLGAINLVAIEEYAACNERKEYLDRQNADLQAGLETLETAIGKIDRETRARFRETFDRVNEHFQTLFPQIFGGGRAYMELTGDNLLDAGIRIMACPPGKRNSTIHLLSGGEKAMTAIALVFSIFQLNPAPFCLLDEVDAPLDDANISRFCDLVKTMSEKTQFIFISHNKLAIEMAGHLMGVTMNEPGVSRMVTVNVEEAVSLAGN